MCLDEALLDRSAQATCRLYRWQPATVSLGYFQDYQAIVAQLPPGMPVVRRITGGGAIWHEHEITYSIVYHSGVDLPTQQTEVFARLHGAIQAAVRALGGRDLGRQVMSTGDRRYREEPRCFASPAKDDLIDAAGAKILGSAARQRGERCLIHGSLKLASNPWDGDAVAGCGLDADSAIAALQRAVSSALDLPLRPGELTTAEQARWQELKRLRYGDEAWVQRRQGPRA